jgi:hypothetical protein
MNKLGFVYKLSFKNGDFSIHSTRNLSRKIISDKPFKIEIIHSLEICDTCLNNLTNIYKIGNCINNKKEIENETNYQLKPEYIQYKKDYYIKNKEKIKTYLEVNKEILKQKRKEKRKSLKEFF